MDNHMPIWIRRLWVLPALLLVITCVLFSAQRAEDVYQTYFNPEPLLKYGNTSGEPVPSLQADKVAYYPGETVKLIINRTLRVAGELDNIVYLSPTGEPHGVKINRLQASALAGESEREGAVGVIPLQTPAGVYCLAGIQTIATKYGSETIEWRSTWFYVIEKEK